MYRRSQVNLQKLLRGARLPTRSFTVLALESSADDTCAAVVTSSRQILSNVVVKQHDIHEEFGGIHPFVAIEGHQRNMPGAVQRALNEARLNAIDVDGIAYTRGPGIGGCLSVGSNAAKTLAAAMKKPLVGVHHMQAHALTPFLTTPESDLPQFPFLTLLVSGGHTLLLLANSLTSFRILATTADESIGRAFDKVSRMLSIPWSGLGPGAALERFCSTADTGSELPETKLALACAFQKAAIGQLEEKLTLGLKWCTQNGVQVRHVVVSGGVASNSFLRARLGCLQQASPESPISLLFPPSTLCTDNAAMIAWASMHRFLAGDHDDYSIHLRSKWSIEELAA